MKRIFIMLGVVIVVVLVAWIVWSQWFSGSAGGNVSSNGSGSLPAVFFASQNAQVAKDFLSQMQSTDRVTLGGTAIVSSYALQAWTNTNGSGEALLKQVSSTGWKLISLGGGEANVFGLLQEGVPLATAEKLIAGLGSGTSVSSTSVVTVPTGDAIAIGTARGNVTTKNFYAAADYIDNAERAVVIRQAATYDIVYDVSDSVFSINMFSPPFDAVRQMAEAAFLDSLGVSRQDACKLKVYEIAAAEALSPATEASISLSFCPGAVSVP